LIQNVKTIKPPIFAIFAIYYERLCTYSMHMCVPQALQDAQQQIGAELAQLQQSQRSAWAAQNAASQANGQVGSLTSALNSAQNNAQAAEKAAHEAAQEVGSQERMVAVSTISLCLYY
jgi:hypothetical protein